VARERGAARRTCQLRVAPRRRWSARAMVNLLC